MNKAPEAPKEHYQPVSCAMHSELELAIMHHHYLHMDYIDINTRQKLTIIAKPYDIVNHKHQDTMQSGEFLLCYDSRNKLLEFRLDCIMHYSYVKNNNG